jgi:hypothetical protein
MKFRKLFLKKIRKFDFHYSSSLSMTEWISVSCMFFVRWGWWGLRKDQGIWNSFTIVCNLTDLILTTNWILLSVIVECRTVWINWYRLFNFSACRYNHGGTRCRSWYSHCAAGSNPDGVIVLHLLIPSGRTMNLGSTRLPGKLRSVQGLFILQICSGMEKKNIKTIAERYSQCSTGKQLRTEKFVCEKV